MCSVVTATYAFEGVEAKHMSFQAGATIEVIEKQEDWWHGRIGDQSGWFPSNRVADVVSNLSSPMPEVKQKLKIKVTITNKMPIYNVPIICFF